MLFEGEPATAVPAFHAALLARETPETSPCLLAHRVALAAKAWAPATRTTGRSTRSGE